MIRRSTFLELAQGFGLVTPDSFSSRKLGGVWAQDYLAHMSPAPSGSLTVKLGDALEIRNKVVFEFYLGLPQL